MTLGGESPLQCFLYLITPQKKFWHGAVIVFFRAVPSAARGKPKESPLPVDVALLHLLGCIG